ncbi:acyltransferase [Halopiger xanaduensis]|uniref:Acetyltransferase n=1 Tax=Halopiger xanaduensis (strain DSM 18323 / JCM 14033 / SH-6) TaxID=797210 RepID=F8DAP0_HALXS|nr:acyltransferase [Halopiger xanaduensis]AEH36982.1 hypothetical protein Halxa_2360 [Halopiger xanaduensis SH-6]
MRLVQKLRRRVKDSIYRFWGIYSHLGSDAYISELESRGCEVGEGTRFYGENNVDLGYAPQISIGKNCIITDKVRMLAHAKDKPILSQAFDTAPNYSKRGTIDIGDNVFLGERTIVLPDVSIGDNVIIGAGSVISSDIPSNSVAVGVPCEVKCSLEEYRDRRLSTEEADIEEVTECYRDQNRPFPDWLRSNTE